MAWSEHLRARRPLTFEKVRSSLMSSSILIMLLTYIRMNTTIIGAKHLQLLQILYMSCSSDVIWTNNLRYGVKLPCTISAASITVSTIIPLDSRNFTFEITKEK